MKPLIVSVIIATSLLAAGRSQAQTYDTNNVVVQTFAGFGIPGYVDGQGQLTAFSNPSQIVADTAGNLYVWDGGNYRIRKITPDGTVTTHVGGGSYFQGYGTNVSFSWGQVGAMAIDHANTIWMSFVSYSGYAYLLTIGTNGLVAIENGGLTNLNNASGLAFDSANRLYYSGANRIYRYNPVTHIVEPFAGSGTQGNYDGFGTSFSAFNNPTALACDQADNIYVFDAGSGLIRRVGQNQNVATIAGNSAYWYSNSDGVGTNASFSGVTSMFPDHAGNLYFMCGGCIRKMNAQTNVVTVAGVFNQYSPSFANGPGELARFNNAFAGCFAQGMIFVADAGNNRIRNISFSVPSQVLPPANLQLNTYPGIQITGTIGRTYQIQTSPDLNSWTTTATLLLSTSPYLWIDQNPVNGSKYYRAILLP